MNIEKAKRGRKGDGSRDSRLSATCRFSGRGATLSEERSAQSGRPVMETQGKNMQENAQPAAARQTAARARHEVVVRKLQKDDIFNSLVAGWNDLKAAPKYGLTIGALHTLGGWVAIFFAKLSGLNYFTYPFLTGIALIAPFSAAVLYEVSRRLETGEPLSWGAVLHAVKTSGGRDLGWMCLVSLFSFILWIDYSFFLYLMFYGAHMPDPAQSSSRRRCPRPRASSSSWSAISSAA